MKGCRPFETVLDCAASMYGGIPESSKRKILGDNAKRLYGWEG